VPSPYHEPKALYLLEAMAAGVPFVAPGYGTFPELVSATGGGMLAKSSAPGDMADALLALWKDDERAKDLGRAGYHRVRERFTLDHMAERVESVYREAIEGSGGTR
jgi:glycosyltransferase involved in cell wall biosynthesis